MTDDTKALVDEARVLAGNKPYTYMSILLIDCAKAIESQAATIERLERENAELRNEVAILQDPDDEPSAGDYECTR